MDEKKSCRWGLLMRQASVIARFKNKLRLKKLEWKEFFEQIWGPAHLTPESEADFQEWADSNHGTEGSGPSQYNSQCFDSLSLEEVSELIQQGQIPSLLGHQGLESSEIQHDFQGMCGKEGDEEFPPMVGNGYDDVIPIGPQGLDHAQQLSTPWTDHTGSFDPTPLTVSEYLNTENTDEHADSISEFWRMSPHLGNRSISAPVPTMRNVDMKDSGYSSAIPSRPEDGLQWLKQFFDIGAEEAITKSQQASTGPGWRVMVRIVCACRKLSKLLRTRKLQRSQPGQVSLRKRGRSFGENRSQKYKGVRKRNEKWVSEVRVGQTNEKVWLGSYDTEKEAALAFDAGKYHCSAKRCWSFNFPNSPRLLGPPIDLRVLSPNDRKKTIKRLAEDHAKAAAAATE